MLFTKFFKEYKALCLNLNEVKIEILFSYAILLKLKQFNKLSIILLHVLNGSLLWQTMVFVVSEEVILQPLHMYFWTPFLCKIHQRLLQNFSFVLNLKIILELEFFAEHFSNK